MWTLFTREASVRDNISHTCYCTMLVKQNRKKQPTNQDTQIKLYLNNNDKTEGFKGIIIKKKFSSFQITDITMLSINSLRTELPVSQEVCMESCHVCAITAA